MLLLVSAALAEPLEARVDRKRFVPAAALAGREPSKPGTMWLVLTDRPMTCADLLAQKPQDERARPVFVGFLDANAGTTSREVYGTSDVVDGTATLVSVPDAVGGRGTVRFALDGRKDRLEGDVAYELCELIGPKPVLTAELAPVERTLSERSLFPDQPPDTMRVRVSLPVGWTEVPPNEWTTSARWKAPDGMTSLTLALAPPFRDLAAEGATFTSLQLDAFATPPYQSEAKSAGLVGNGAYALYWVSRTGANGRWAHALDVFRQEADWPQQVHCNLTTDEAGAAALVEPVRAACASIERLP